MPVLLVLLLVLLVTKVFALSFIRGISWIVGVLQTGLLIKVARFFLEE